MLLILKQNGVENTDLIKSLIIKLIYYDVQKNVFQCGRSWVQA
jgi:hypothetical protein